MPEKLYRGARWDVRVVGDEVGVFRDDALVYPLSVPSERVSLWRVEPSILGFSGDDTPVVCVRFSHKTPESTDPNPLPLFFVGREGLPSGHRAQPTTILVRVMDNGDVVYQTESTLPSSGPRTYGVLRRAPDGRRTSVREASPFRYDNFWLEPDGTVLGAWRATRPRHDGRETGMYRIRADGDELVP